MLVTARHPKHIEASRIRSEVMNADPSPIRRTIGGMRQATAEEIGECLSFAGHDEPMMSKIAIERLVDHLEACGFVLMSKDDALQS